jgi:hypothetical protein
VEQKDTEFSNGGKINQRRKLQPEKRATENWIWSGICHGSKAGLTLEPGRSTSRIYFRAAQAYMLISMPTGTSMIFGVFQVIQVSHSRRVRRADRK